MQLGEQIYEKIDRAYSDERWRSSSPEDVVWNYPIFLSNHGPIVLDLISATTKSRCPYGYDSCCWSFEEIKHMINDKWKKKYKGS